MVALKYPFCFTARAHSHEHYLSPEITCQASSSINSLLKKMSSVFIGNAANDAAGIPGGYYHIRDVLCYDGSGADNHIVSDVNARANYGIAADPYIVSDRNRFSLLVPRISGFRVNRVTGSIDGNIGRHLAVISDRYLRHIEDRTVVVCKKVFAHLNVSAIIAIKRRVNKCIFGFPEQFLYDFLNRVKIGAVNRGCRRNGTAVPLAGLLGRGQWGSKVTG